MKKNLFFVFAAALSLAACTKKAEPVISQEALTVVEATVPQTKTILENNAGSTHKVLWQAGDAISVNGVASNETVVAEGAESAKFKFTASLSNPLDAVYPASVVTSYYNRKASITLPMIQSYVKDSFDPKAAVLCTSGTVENGLQFNHAMGYLKVVPTMSAVHQGETIYSFTMNSPVAISGAFTLDFQTGALTPGPAAMKMIIVSLGGANIGTGEGVIVALPCGTIPAGLTLQLQDSKGHVYTSTTRKAITIEAGKLYNTSLEFDPAVAPTTTPSALVLGGAAAEENGQAFRKDGDKFIIYNRLTDGGVTFTDGEGKSYFADASGNLFVGGAQTAVTSTGNDVARIIVDFGTKKVTVDRIGEYAHLKYAATYFDITHMQYQGKGVWKSTGVDVRFIDPNDPSTNPPGWLSWVEERYYFIINVNGTEKCWGSIQDYVSNPNMDLKPNGNEHFYDIDEFAWSQWDHCWKFAGEINGTSIDVEINTNDNGVWRHTITKNEPVQTGAVITGAAAEIDGQKMRAISQTRFQVYSRLSDGPLSFVIDGQKYYFDASNNLLSGEGAGTAVASANNHVTRITVDLAANKVTFDSIDAWVHLKFAATYFDVAHLEYAGNGTWKATNVPVKFIDPNDPSTNPPGWLSWVEERYYFILDVNGANKCWGSIQDYVGNPNMDLKPNGNEHFYDIAEFDWSQWDHCWKFAGEMNGATVDIEINTNDNGVWKHTITKK